MASTTNTTRNRTRIPVVLIVGMIAAGCATASNKSSGSAAEDPSDNIGYMTNAEVREDPDRIICRRYKPTGSRLSEKICMTARQWHQMAEDSRRALDSATRAPAGGAAPEGTPGGS